MSCRSSSSSCTSESGVASRSRIDFGLSSRSQWREDAEQDGRDGQRISHHGDTSLVSAISCKFRATAYSSAHIDTQRGAGNKILLATPNNQWLSDQCYAQLFVAVRVKALLKSVAARPCRFDPCPGHQSREQRANRRLTGGGKMNSLLCKGSNTRVVSCRTIKNHPFEWMCDFRASRIPGNSRLAFAQQVAEVQADEPYLVVVRLRAECQNGRQRVHVDVL